MILQCAAATALVVPAAIQTPRKGRPPKLEAELKASSKRWRRWAERKKHPEIMEAVVEAAAITAMVKEPRKRGRPSKPFDELTPRAKESRKYRERRAAALLLVSTAMCQEAEAAARAAQDAERKAKRQEQRKRRLDAQLREHNVDGARGLLLCAAFVREEEEKEEVEEGEDAAACEECAIGTLCDGLRGDDAKPRALRCCGVQVCSICLRKCFEGHGKRVPVGYREAANGERGRNVYTDPIDAHRCPWCRQPILSVLRAFV